MLKLFFEPNTDVIEEIIRRFHPEPETPEPSFTDEDEDEE